MVIIDPRDYEEVENELAVFDGVRGSIVRIYMEDFLTYRKVEMRAGAHVNLILGLNATGKSTIVCAICLGLAGKTSILGRANSLRLYIRRGADSATVEIELFNPGGMNFVIRRTLLATEKGSMSEWYLNSRSVSKARILALTKELNIQLDNLCQFLPQDRVQEFAEMDSIKLLTSTEEAIGNTTLSSHHNRLIEINAGLVTNEAKLLNTNDKLRQAKQISQSLEADVQAYRQRQAVLRKIEKLSQDIAWIKYIDAGAIFNAKQSQSRELTMEKKKEEKTLIPLKKVIDRLEAALAREGSQKETLRRNSFARWYRVQRDFNTEKENCTSFISEINAHLVQAERKEKDKATRQLQFAKKVADNEKELADFMSDGFDEILLRDELVELESQKEEIMRGIIEINFWNEKDIAEKGGLNRSIQKMELELSRLDDLRGSRLKYLEKKYPHVVKAIKHFENPENRSRFKGEIHEPMILFVSVNDLMFGGIAERHLGITDMIGFFCEREEDVETMIDISLKLGLRISAIHHSPDPRFVKPKSSLSPEFLKKHHFKKVLGDLIEAPNYYLSYIYQNAFPQDVPIGGTDETDKESEEIVNGTNLRTFYTDAHMYRVTVSVYSKKKCTRRSYIRNDKAELFTTEINANEKTKLQGLISSMKEDYQKLSDNIAARAAEVKKKENMKEGIIKKVNSVNSKIQTKHSLEQKLKSSKETARKLESEFVDLTQIRLKAKKDCFSRRVKKLGCLEAFGKAVKEICVNGKTYSVKKKILRDFQWQLNITHNQFEDTKSRVDAYNEKLNDINIQVKKAKTDADKLKEEALKTSSEPSKQVVDGTLVLEELERQFNIEQGNKVNLAERDVSVINEYEEKLKQVGTLTAEKEELETVATTLNSELDVRKEQWLGPLEDLIERINSNFSGFFKSMQCRGKVYLSKGEQENDFSKYGVKIKVSFRDNGPMSELCGWKQSGGERAITTALYVLALQKLTTVPFRVIDEINQGMDAKNELRFFNLLCSLADGPGTPQYFLLSPKMLPTVDYPDNVCMHFILNGPHVKDMFANMGTPSAPTTGRGSRRSQDLKKKRKQLAVAHHSMGLDGSSGSHGASARQDDEDDEEDVDVQSGAEDDSDDD